MSIVEIAIIVAVVALLAYVLLRAPRSDLARESRRKSRFWGDDR